MPGTRCILIVFLLILALSGWGCAITGGGGSGPVILDTGGTSPGGRPGAGNGQAAGQAKGHEIAAKNHIRSAYRFLEMGKPGHAQKEIEKARGKMGEDFWFHYYLGGALFLQGKNREASQSWERAFGLTGDTALRSRVRTCQSFAAYRTEGSSTSIGFLRHAVDLDGGNLTARNILQELSGSGELSSRKDQGKGKESGKPKSTAGGAKGKGGKKRIEEERGFREYFLIGMPAE